ncbi:cobalt-zinc-cadmium resistance protein [Liquorilactobacillus sucicola DSM 21376 = JCM 15457]|uniref:Cobalt-zinc-cadmium resistance protein n=1 Tax=Liquorilactobacillus sucicola DSM 21376 = JCM 15457 TaxID=1423806 RepID=A0A0R2DYT2_9LACO|nr:cation transporter [Liquorilactobacillus sucicola]KRN06215.1 cobalt-zinc-cadmium resistance protein [Liquorilactobacillus sucicola DSM 21376 = JCM 15457]
MNIHLKKVEQNALLFSASTNFVMAVAGVIAFHSTHIQAIFLDAYFSVIAMLSSFAAIFISHFSGRKTAHFPRGLYMLEPLYGMFKALFSLIITIIAVCGSIRALVVYIVMGVGERLELGPVLPYTLVMIAMSFALAYYCRKKNHSIMNASTMLLAESKIAFMDGILSVGVGLGIILAYFLGTFQPFKFIMFIGDSLITLLLVALTIKEPLKLLWRSFVEFAHGTITDKKINDDIRNVLKKRLTGTVKNFNFEVVKIGMRWNIKVFLHKIPVQVGVDGLTKFKKEIESDLKDRYENLNVTFLLA